MRGIIRGTGPAGLLAAAVTAALAGALDSAYKTIESML